MSVLAFDDSSAPENIASRRDASVQALVNETRTLLSAGELESNSIGTRVTGVADRTLGLR